VEALNKPGPDGRLLAEQRIHWPDPARLLA